MSAPDPRFYLRETDLRTAEDVARWLEEQIYEWDADCDTANPRQVVACVVPEGFGRTTRDAMERVGA